MPIRNKWFWIPYLIILGYLIIHKVYNFFIPGSPLHLYYAILTPFDLYFKLSYGLAFLQVIFNVIHYLPVLFYATGTTFGNPRVWQQLFILRIVFDVAGNSFLIQTLSAAYHENPAFCGLLLFSSIFPHIPSYYACFHYAFRQNARK